jgi:hypothetical protein
MKKRVRQPELDNRLRAYAATIRLSPSRDLLRRSAEKWPVYAAVTGAALAMSSGASASIIYSGVINNTAAASAPSSGQSRYAEASVQLKNGTGGLLSRSFFLVNARRQFLNSRAGLAAIFGGSVRFLANSFSLKQLSSGAVISAGAANSCGCTAFIPGTHGVAERGIYTSGGQTYPIHYGWSRTKAFAGFSFNPSSTGGKTDYGWVRLQFVVGQDGALDSITAIDWAYQDDGSAILAGDTGVSGAPEPSTAALTFLALGAAGVEALRRRRRAA